MSTLPERLAQVRARIAEACDRAGRDPAAVELLPVSKTRPAAVVREALELGLDTFGENRVQELATKARELEGSGARWHLIGSLQTNKCRELARVPGLALVQSLDRRKLADKLQAAFDEVGAELACLVQVDATGEAQKHGVTPDVAESLVRHVLAECPALRLDGAMAMGPLHGDPAPVFAEVAALRERLRDACGLPLPILSLGMTGDLDVAIAAGSTMVRVGTGVFGPRG